MSPLLNYTTTVSVARTIEKVQASLIEAGARQIMTTYGDRGEPIGVHFTIETAHGRRAFTLPVEAKRVERVLIRDPRVAPRFQTTEQAERVAWRIVKDWLEAQLAIVKTEMVTFDQVMLPYMHGLDGATVWEMYLGDQLPALGAGKIVDA
jgi:hypothetical protein